MGKSNPKFNRETDSQTQASESLKDSQHTNHHFNAVKINPNQTSNLLKRVGGVGEFEGERGTTFASLAKPTTHICTFKPSISSKKESVQRIESINLAQKENQTRDSHKTSKSPQQVKSSTEQISESQKDSLFTESTDSLISTPKGITMPTTSQKGQEMKKISKSTNIQVKSAKAPKLYRPIIASALATALGASVAVAQVEMFAGNTANPTTPAQFTGDTLNWSATGDFYKPQFTPNGGTATDIDIENLKFNFDWTDGNITGLGSNNDYTATIHTENISRFKITSNKALQIGATGTGTLNINMYDPSNTNTKRSFVLDLSQVTTTENNRKIAFKGNIEVNDGFFNDKNKPSEFEAKFGGDMIGEIRLGMDGRYTDPGTKTFTFLNGSQLQGGVKVGRISGIINFEGNGGGITQGVDVGLGGYSGYLTLNFKGTSGSIGGEVSLNKGSLTIEGTNLDFRGGVSAKSDNGKMILNLTGQNNLIGKDIGNANDSIYSNNSILEINLNPNSKLTTEGQIQVKGGGGSIFIKGNEADLHVKTNITDESFGGDSLIDISVKSLTLGGDIYSSHNNGTKITLNGGNSTIGGNIISSQHNGKKASHDIILNGGTLSVTGVIRGAGSATFTLNDSATLTLNGTSNPITALTATGNNNTLTITNNGANNTISTLTLGAEAAAESDTKNGTLTLENTSALNIATLQVGNNAKGTLNLLENKGDSTIDAINLSGGTLTLNNEKATALTTTLTTSGTSTLNLVKGETTITNQITANNGVSNTFNIGGTNNATLTLEQGFQSNGGGENKFFIKDSGDLRLSNITSAGMLTTEGQDSLTHFDISANAQFNFNTYYNALTATNGGKNSIVSAKDLSLTTIASTGDKAQNIIGLRDKTLKLTGDITATNTGKAEGSGNEVNAKVISMASNSIIANNGVNQIGIFSELTVGTLDAQKAGLNEIIVSNPGTTITLKSMKAQSAGENKITVPDSGTLTLQGDGNATPIAMSASEAGSKNYIYFKGNTLNITGNITADQGGVNELDINALSLTGNISATGSADSKNIISLGAGSSSVSGNITEASGGQNLFTLAGTDEKNKSTLTLNGANNAITTLDMQANSEFISDGTGTLTIGTLTTTNTSTLTFNKGTNTIKGGVENTQATFNVGNGTDNASLTFSAEITGTGSINLKDKATLTLNGGNLKSLSTAGTTTVSFASGTTTIGGAITAGTKNDFNLANSSAVFEGAISGTNNFKLDSNGANGNKTVLTLKGASNAINTFTALGGDNQLTITNNTTGTNKIATLNLGDSASNGTTKGSLTIDNNSDKVLEITNFASQDANNVLIINKGAVKIADNVRNAGFDLNNASILTLEGQDNTMNALRMNKSSVFLNSKSNAINALEFKGLNNILNLNGAKNQITTLTLAKESTGNIIDLATNGANLSEMENRTAFRLLSIGNKDNTNAGIKGEGSIEFKAFINPSAKQDVTLGGTNASNGKEQTNTYGYAYSDRIIIHNALGDKSTSINASMKLYGAEDMNQREEDFKSIAYTSGGTETEGNVAIATIKKSNAGAFSNLAFTQEEIKNQGAIVLNTGTSAQGFQIINPEFIAVATDENGKVNGNGNQDYLTYFVKRVSTRSVEGLKEMLPSLALSSVELYLANFNSLNKRMGELRDNTYSQGAWARVFNGQQSNDLGLKSTMNYVSIQAGYDYGFGLGEKATNYLGFALSYSTSALSESQESRKDYRVALKINDLKSDLVEFALYNSYIEDEGWFNDSIVKFSYLMNSIGVASTTQENYKGNMNSFAFMLSNEFGYRFLLGENKEWYIDPQAELGMGYINGSGFDLKDSRGRDQLDAELNSLLNLRTRLGATFGYDFKDFTQENLKAKLYLGLFGEIDYFNGGDTIAKVPNITKASFLDLDARAVLNLGTNLEVKESTRIYVDFETSFGGKITTDYKINAGVRYNFGEKMDYSDLKDIKPIQAKDTPVKLKEENIESKEKEVKKEEKKEEKKEVKKEEKKETKGGENKANKK